MDLNRASKSAEAERLVSAGRVEDDAAFELKLRPTRLAEFIGQTKAKEQLAIALEAAKSRGEALDHVLLFGPPGLGKTTLATIIANELDVGFQQTSGPALVLIGTANSLAMICAKVVLPSPGGPYNSTWSSASPRLLAA